MPVRPGSGTPCRTGFGSPPASGSSPPTSGTSCNPSASLTARLFLWSRDHHEDFWDRLVRAMHVEWFEPYRQVVDASPGPEWTQWFVGGQINIAHNCLDRWAETGRIAIRGGGERGGALGSRSYVATPTGSPMGSAGRTSSGDRVALVLPMVPEIVAILYGCFKVGFTVVPIFAGFGEGAIATRLADSGARVVFTAETGAPRQAPSVGGNGEAARASSRTIVVDGPLRRVADECETQPIPEARASSSTPRAPPASRRARSTRTPALWRRSAKRSGLASTIATTDRFFWLSDIGWMMGPWTILGNHLFGGTILLYDGAPDYPGPTASGRSSNATALRRSGSRRLPSASSARAPESWGRSRYGCSARRASPGTTRRGMVLRARRPPALPGRQHLGRHRDRRLLSVSAADSAAQIVHAGRTGARNGDRGGRENRHSRATAPGISSARNRRRP